MEMVAAVVVMPKQFYLYFIYIYIFFFNMHK